jgi:hypothetical protein
LGHPEEALSLSSMLRTGLIKDLEERKEESKRGASYLYPYENSKSRKTAGLAMNCNCLKFVAVELVLKP